MDRDELSRWWDRNEWWVQWMAVILFGGLVTTTVLYCFGG